MADKSRQPDAYTSAEAMFGAGRPAFGRARRGFDPKEVTPYFDLLERERADLGAALVLAQTSSRDLAERLERFEALEEELTRAVHQARETADAMVADAQERAAATLAEADERAAATLAEGRAALARDERELDGLRMAVAAEAASLAALEDTSHISRAAAALVGIVDGPGGLGAFSRATGTLLEFAQLLQRTARGGSAPELHLDITDGDVVVSAPAPDPAADPAPVASTGVVDVDISDTDVNGTDAGAATGVTAPSAAVAARTAVVLPLPAVIS